MDETLIPTLETAISEAKSAKQTIMEMPATEDEIIAATQQLDSLDYSSVLSNLSEKKSALEKVSSSMRWLMLLPKHMLLSA